MKQVSEETRKRMSESAKKYWNKLSETQRKSKTKSLHTDETRNKISLSCKGRKAWNKGLKGFSVKEEVKKKISKTNKENWNKLSFKQRKIKMEKIVNNSDRFWKSKLEEIVLKQLEYYNVKYIRQKIIGDKDNFYIIDFYLPQFEIVLEINGEYWHNLPDKIERDNKLKQFVESHNKKIVFIWECEIKDDWFCILDYINACYERNEGRVRIGE